LFARGGFAVKKSFLSSSLRVTLKRRAAGFPSFFPDLDGSFKGLVSSCK